MQIRIFRTNRFTFSRYKYRNYKTVVQALGFFAIQISRLTKEK